jgi:hypothetical protein
MIAAGSTGLASLAKLYGFAAPAAVFITQHIDTLKSADNILANRCGLVLEATQQGFGVGGEVGLMVIGLGQAILGNPLAGKVAVAGGTNPVVLTCAAIGAIHYGWSAMSQGEKDKLVNQVATAFKVGVELVRSLATFTLSTIRAVLSRQNVEELKRYVRHAAALFGHRLSDVTHKISDRIHEGATAVRGLASRVSLPSFGRARET